MTTCDTIINSIVVEKLISSKQKVLDIVSKQGELLHYFSEYMNDVDVVLAAVSNDGMCLRFASVELQDNIKIVLAAIKRDPRAFTYASLRLRSDRIIIHTALNSPIKFINYMGKFDNDLWKLKFILAYIPKIIRDDRDFILQILPVCGHLMNYVINLYQNDQEILTALARAGNSISYTNLPPELKNNKDVVFEAVSKNGLILEHVSEEFRTQYPEIEEIAIKNDPNALNFVSNKLRHDYDRVLELVSRNDVTSIIYTNILPEFKEDRIITLAAVKQNALMLGYAPEKFYSDKEIMFEVVSKLPPMIYFAPTRFLQENIDLVILALRSNTGWNAVTSKIEVEYKLLYEIVKNDVTIIPEIYEKIKCYPELLFEAIKNYYSKIKSYQVSNLSLIKRPISDLGFIYKLISINLPNCKPFDAEYYLIRQAQCIDNMNICQPIKNELLLMLFA